MHTTCVYLTNHMSYCFVLLSLPQSGQGSQYSRLHTFDASSLDDHGHSEDHHEDPIRVPFNPKNSQSFPLKSHLPSGKLT